MRGWGSIAKFVMLLAGAAGSAGVAGAAVIRVEGPENRAGWFRDRVPTLVSEVEGALGFRYDGPVIVRLARSERDFERLAGKRPDWVVAIARPAEASLVVALSRIDPARGIDVSSVLRHELVHVLLPSRVGGRSRVPLWFEEGLAQVLGSRLNRSDLDRLPIAAKAGNLIPLAEISERFPQSASAAALSYAQGESVVLFLIDEHGIGGLRDLLDAIGKRGSLDAAVRADLGIAGGVGELEDDWREWLVSGRPWWLALFGSAFLPFLFFIASVLAILAAIRAIRRKRDVYESLPD